MANSLVQTKFYLPRPRRSLIARPRLSELLNRDSDARLTLISAPAGFGKTTLLTAWLAAMAETRAVAWLSLDESDRQPATFWTYVITALQKAVPGVGADTLRILGFSLFALILASFALAAIAAVGFLPAGVWGWSTVVGAAGSLAMLVLFFHPYLAVGVAIDLLALWTVLILGWTPTDTPTT